MWNSIVSVPVHCLFIYFWARGLGVCNSVNPNLTLIKLGKVRVSTYFNIIWSISYISVDT